jgi:hypothetical protein
MKSTQLVEFIKKVLKELGAITSEKKVKADIIYKKGIEMNYWNEVNKPLATFRSQLSNKFVNKNRGIARDINGYGYYLVPDEEVKPNSAHESSEEKTISSDTSLKQDSQINELEIDGELETDDESDADNELESNDENIIPNVDVPDIKTRKIKQQREKLLYPFLKNWLNQTKGYKSKIISETKNGGKWGNPDIAGLRLINHSVFWDLEICTIEAKISKDNWKYDIFESISHLRFANKSYFAFALPSDNDFNFQEITDYCMQYGIGMVVIYLNTESFKKLNYGDEDFSLDEENDEIVINEIIPAKYNLLTTDRQIRFLKQYNINDITSMDGWK